LITHLEYEAHKVGVAGITSDRLSAHRRQGWRTFRVVQLPTGAQAYAVEQAVLMRLRREYRALPFITREHMPQNGHTETFSANAISLPELERLVHEEIARLDLRPL